MEEATMVFRVAISGSIGVGKTSVIDHFRDKPGYGSHKETINKEVLDLFYKHKNNKTLDGRIEKLNQFHFLNESITRDIISYYAEEPVQIYDRPIVDHTHVFAYMNLPQRDWALLVGMQEIFLNQLKFEKYDLSIVLDCDFNENLQRIYGRNREVEVEADTQYFKSLVDRYRSDDYIDALSGHSNKVIVIDTTAKTKEEVNKEIEEIILKEKAFQDR
jgi:deoxyadenosine/deoxycytidine kinase